MTVEVRLKDRANVGPFLERVDIETNDPRTPLLRLPVSGELRPVVTAKPQYLSFGPLRAGESSTHKVEVVAVDGKAFSIERVEFDPDIFDIDYIAEAAAPSRRVAVTFRPKNPGPTLFNTQIVLRIDHPELKEIIVPVRAEVSSVFTAIPARLLALIGESGESFQRRFEIEGPNRHVPAVIELQATGEWGVERWQCLKSELPGRIGLEVTLRAPQVSGFQKGSLEVQCETADEPRAVVIVPFAGIVREIGTPPTPSGNENNDIRADVTERRSEQ